MFDKKLKRKEETDIESSDFEVQTGPDGVVEDAVFGQLNSSGPNYRNVGQWGALILMTKANLGLGVLALPSVFGVLGIVPGVLCILVVQTIIAYCSIVIGTFKLNHPEVYGLADAGYVFGGRIGKWFLYVVYCVFMIFIIGSALVGISTALNAVSAHGACTAIFVFVAAVAGFFVGSIRTLGRISWIGWVGIVSIMSAIITLTIAVGVQDRPPYPAPQVGPWDKDLKIFGNPSFAAAMSAVNGIVFSYGATPMYFGIVSEMKDPRKYARMMVVSIIFLTVVYLVIGCVVYYYCGQYVASPALGSAGTLLKKVCYGIAIPGLLASLTLFTHLCGKTLFVQILAGSKHLTSNSVTHWATWLSCTFASVFIGYLIASGIPIFGPLISLIGALLCPIVCILAYNCAWFYDNISTVPRDERKKGWKFWAGVNLVIFAIGLFLMGAGIYGAVVDLKAATSSAGAWSCVDNSNSVPS